MRRSRKPLGVDLASRGFESLPLRSTSRIRRVDGVSGTLISGIREQFVGGWKPPEAAQEGRVTGTRLALSDLTITVLRSNPLVIAPRSATGFHPGSPATPCSWGVHPGRSIREAGRFRSAACAARGM